MMNAVVILDIICLLALIVAVFFLGANRRRDRFRDQFWIIFALLFLRLFRDISNILQWSGISSFLESFEDYPGMLEPVLWGFLFYSLIQGSIKRNLKDEKAKYHLFEDYVSDVLWMANLDGKLTYVSPSVKRHQGYTVEDAMAQGAYGSLTPESLQVAQSVLGKELARDAQPNVDPDRSVRVEVEQYHKNGPTIWSEIRISLERDVAGAPIGLIGVTRDISKRVEAERAQRESEKKFAAAFEYAPLFMIISEPETGRLINVNESFVEKTGFSKDEAIGKSSVEIGLTQEEDRQRLMTEFKTHGSLKGFELPIRIKSGETIHTRLHGQFITIGGETRLLIIGDDITEQKRAQLALTESEEQYRTIFDTTNDALTILMDGIFIDCNPKALVDFGCSKDQLIGKTPGELSPEFQPDGRKSVEIATQKTQLALSGKPQVFEWQHNRLDGTPFDTEISLSSYTLGDEGGLIAAIRDVTDRKRAENALLQANTKLNSINQELTATNEEMEAQYEELKATTDELYEVQNNLKKSEKRLKLHIANTPMGVIQWNKNFDVIAWNPAAEQLFGYTAKEALGHHAAGLLVPENAKEHVDKTWSALLEQAGGTHSINENLTKDGRTILCEWFNSPLTDETGNIYGYASMVVDITERKQAEDQLRRLGTAIEQAAESVVITDIQGIIQYVNPVFCQTTGYTEEEAIGQNPRLLQSDHHDEDFYQELWDTISSGKSWQGRFVNKKKDGTIFQEDTTISPVLDPEGKIINYVAVKRDVSMEVSLEAQLRQTQKLEGIGVLAGGIAHDFNNILFAILGYSDLALGELPPDNTAVEFIKEITTAGHRAADLVKQILTFARRTERKTAPIDLVPLIKEVAKLMRSVLPTGIEVKLRLTADKCIVDADPTEIHQVLMNLCTNAGHVMMAIGGRLEIGLRDVEVDENLMSLHPGLSPGSYALLSVSDTGPGIPPEIKERMFEPFFTTKELGEGTGMGLSVVHGIVTELGGIITVYSELGEGATLNVYLPHTVRKREDKPISESGLPRGTERIAIVDDEPTLAAMLEHMLNSLGYEVTAFTNSGAALETILASPASFNLLITDQSMPGLTGSELAQEVLKARADLPIILCTGFSQTISEEQAKDLGIAAYLLKPLTTRNLAMTIRGVLDG